VRALERLQVGAHERAVAPHVGELHAQDAPALDRGRELERVHAGGFVPAVAATRPSRASIATATASGKRASAACTTSGRDTAAVPKMTRSSPGPAGAGRLPACARRRPARRDPHGAHHVGDGLRLRQAVHRRVQVDEVDAPGALGLEAARHVAGAPAYTVSSSVRPWRRRTTRPPRRSIAARDHAALREATAADEVGGEPQAMPWLFSGWNCRPSTLPRPTIAGTRAVVGGGDHDVALRVAVVGVDEVDVRSVRDALE